MKLFILLLATVSLLEAVSLNGSQYSVFQEYEKKFNLTFENAKEREFRFSVFLKNLQEIDRLNLEYPEATFGITSLTHLTKEEFSQRMIPSDIVTPGSPDFVGNFTQKSPSYFDWRTTGVVQHIKNQQDCGDCYAFAAAAAVESYIAIKTRVIHDLSEQQILDCDSKSQGCSWGYLYTALDIAKNTGLVTSATYPYADKKGSCRGLSGTRFKISGNNWLPKNENSIQDAVYNNGPVPFIMVCPSALQHYTGGIFSLDANQCKAQSVGNHIPVLVGYSSDYWIIKNSWGTNWGENGKLYVKCETIYDDEILGFFRLKKGINACDMTMEARSIY